MKFIITENQNDRLMVLRRIPELRELIPNLFSYMYPCNADSLDIYFYALRWEMFQVLSFKWFKGLDEDYIWSVFMEVFGSELKQHYIDSCNNSERLNENFDLSTFDPITYIKNVFSKKKDLDKGDIGNSWEKKDEIQKLVDIMVKVIQKKYNFDLIKGIQVVKIHSSSWGSHETPIVTEDINVVLKPILPSWVNPRNKKFSVEFKKYREVFKEVEKYMSLGHTQGERATKINFYLNAP